VAVVTGGTRGLGAGFAEALTDAGAAVMLVGRRHWIEDAPLERYGSVAEFAPAIVFLARDASTFVTGSVLVADGGYTTF
jgi:NAD(P)-dependent dehydrogenase (short-subunit alcohol dehydrogenase family)